MPRRAIRLKTKAPSPELAQKYFRHWSQGELYQHPEHFPRLASPAFFGNECPLDLEIGCGTGEFLCWLAAQEPEVNFVGVDVFAKALYKGVEEASEMGLENIMFIRAPIQFVYPVLPDNAIRTIYMHYPDPHLRARGQHKIFNSPFLDEVHRVLEPGGTLSLVTDHEALFFEEILPMVEADRRFTPLHEERYLVGYEVALKSRYQKMWEKHEVPPLRLEVKKNG